MGHARSDWHIYWHLVELYNAKAAEGLSGASVRHMHAVIAAP